MDLDGKSVVVDVPADTFGHAYSQLTYPGG
jgi:hypothetical protein